MISEKGFILSRHAVDRKDHCELHYYGRSESGPFKVVITPHKPLFFIPSSTEIPQIPGMTRKKVQLKSFAGVPTDALYFTTLTQYYQTRRELREMGTRMFEADVRPADRYVMERFINSSIEITGEPYRQGNMTVWENPRVRPAEYIPEFSWLSIDIETGPADDPETASVPLYSIALHGRHGNSEFKRALVVGDPGEKDSEPAEIFPTQKAVIVECIAEIKRWDPDLIIGWHVIGFDLKFLAEKCLVMHIPFVLGRGSKNVRIQAKRNGIYSAEIEGRLVIDGPQNMRMAFFKFPDYSLETVAQAVLGRGKDIRPEEEKIQEITRRFQHDKGALARYNLEDCILVTDIFRKTGLIDQITARSRITGLTMDRVNMSVAAFDHVMLPAIHRKGFVAPVTDDIYPGKDASGGYVFTSTPGLYHHVVILDFKSLYPTIIRTFRIDPYSRLCADKDTVITPNGIRFSGSCHILPDLLEKLMSERESARVKGDTYLSMAIKILMNSFYGVMGTSGCRFYHSDLPTAITGTGQWILKKSAGFLRSLGYDVIYGDTDSVFVVLKEAGAEDPQSAGHALMEKVNSYFSTLIPAEFGVESCLEMEFEKQYDKFFLPAKRASSEGTMKRYAGMLADGTIEFKGLEAIRSDWTDLAKRFQEELFSRFFNDLELADWIRAFIERLRSGEFDSQLVYRRRLRRAPELYDKTTPPHIKAARLLDPEGKRHLRDINYIMTVSRGAVPVEFAPDDIDYQHYIEKQVKPLADGVLFALDDSFDAIVDGRQLELF